MQRYALLWHDAHEGDWRRKEVRAESVPRKGDTVEINDMRQDGRVIGDVTEVIHAADVTNGHAVVIVVVALTRTAQYEETYQRINDRLAAEEARRVRALY